MTHTSKPCDHCGADPATRPGITLSTRDHYFTECSNRLDCPVWPITHPHETPEASQAAWEAGEAYED
jgi:hypothetical protein